MNAIVKSFDGQRVLDDVNFDLRAGEVHILVGENGAGKSTLIKILGGVHRPDGGRIEIRGRRMMFKSPREAANHGVAIIHQELSLVPSMSVADNIFLGREQSAGGWLRQGAQRAACAGLLARLGVELDPGRIVDTLPISVQQLIEIAKALAYQADIIVMDEPTSALNEPEVERLFACTKELKSQGCGIIYITHKLEEVYRIADRITVLRDGLHVATRAAADMPADSLVRLMVGRDLVDPGAARAAHATEDAAVRLELEDFSVHAASRQARPLVDRITLKVHAGEIVGLGGLQGSGNSALLLGLFGAYGRRTTGAVRIDGVPYRPSTPRGAIGRGLALVTNDRQRTGLILNISVMANSTLSSLARVSPRGWLRFADELQVATESTQSLNLRAASMLQSVATLSGGNQQKVVLAKWMNTEPQVLLLDEPTRGVDIGAKQEIYQLMNAWRAAGHALILITSEMPELLMMSDRILVMHRGRATATFARGEATQEKILHAAMGGD
ncbi:MAG: sugar ABC transporter ATP-binding protein [Planctomycetota bacterium]